MQANTSQGASSPGLEDLHKTLESSITQTNNEHQALTKRSKDIADRQDALTYKNGGAHAKASDIIRLNVRDEHGRTIKQAALASGLKTLKNDGHFFGTLTDDEISELDPVTKQYPFLTSASHESSDLSTIYVLLSRNPSLLERYVEQTTDDFVEDETRRRKRTRDSDNENGGNDE